MIKALAFTPLFVLISCENEEVKTVQFYMDNQNIMEEKLEECQVQELAELSANCHNAIEAASRLEIQSTKDGWSSQIE